jgi:hypothetical protein
LKAHRAERPNDLYNARDFAVSRKTAAKIRHVRDNCGRAFALRAKLRMHVIEAMRLMLRNAPAMCSGHNATRDA